MSSRHRPGIHCLQVREGFKNFRNGGIFHTDLGHNWSIFFFFYFFSFQISLFLNASLRYVLRRTTRVKGRRSEDKTCLHVNVFRLWCAIQKYKGQLCSLCPPELLSMSANNEPCGLWEELQLLQVRGFIHSFIQRYFNFGSSSRVWKQY